MCGGVCGPAGESYGYRANYSKPKAIKQRKVPYKNHSGTVVACYEGPRMFAQLYKCKRTGEWIASWSSVLSSGAAGWKSKTKAANEYNQHVPKERQI